MLIDLTQEKWEEIRTALLYSGKLPMNAHSSGKLIQFPEPIVQPQSLCAGSEK